MRGGSRLLAAVAIAAAALSACGSAHAPPRHTTTASAQPPPKPIVGTPGVHPESSEALAGHPARARAQVSGCPRHPVEQLISRPTWLDGVAITEYFPTPESWFSGVKVRAPGLPGLHRVDWLYSSSGVAMEGEGIGLDGRYYGIADTGNGPWVTATGQPTHPSACASHWSRGFPLWLTGGWRNAAGAVTFALESGGWSNGAGVHQLGYEGVSFRLRPAPSARPYHTVAVDPNLIPLGSRIYIPAYKPVNGGWFVAGDTGGGIIGRHIDVYRPPTNSINDGGRYLPSTRAYVVPPGSS
jgi:3D (Asp-Asp-Asp) domain-containing protein